MIDATHLKAHRTAASLLKKGAFPDVAEVIRALLDIGAARELVGASRDGVLSARESYDMANKRSMTNTGTITELLDAQLRLTQTENDAGQALAEFHGARARFFYYIGQENPALE